MIPVLDIASWAVTLKTEVLFTCVALEVNILADMASPSLKKGPQYLPSFFLSIEVSSGLMYQTRTNQNLPTMICLIVLLSQWEYHCRIAGSCPGIITCWQTSLRPQLVRPPWQVNTIQKELASQCHCSQAKVWEATGKLWRHSNSLHSQFQTDQMDDYRTSFLVPPQPYPSWCPIHWAQPSPQSTGTKDTASSAEDIICNHPERSNPSLAFSTATLCTRPYNPYTNLQRVYQNYSNKDRSTSAKCSTMESHTMGCSLVAPTALCSTVHSHYHNLSFPLKLILLRFWQ